MAWKRPDSIPYPSVWSTFVGKTYSDREPTEYRIQDIPEELFEDVITHMTRYFLVRESLCATSGIIEEEKSVKEMQGLWREKLKQKMGIIALARNHDTGKEEIAGINITCVAHKSDKDAYSGYDGPIMKKIMRSLKDLETPINVFDDFKVDFYLSALGLSVAPHYHGENIGYQLLMARTKLSKAAGLSLTVTAFSSPTAQHVALKAGFRVVAELNYESYKPDGKSAYPRLNGHMDLMVKEINENTDS